MLNYRLAAGHPLCHHNTVDIKENNMTLNFERLMRAFLVKEVMMSSNALIVVCFLDYS
jgi:hypothetical protein